MGIRSPSTRKRDETVKLTLYERGGVSEYWVVDPERDVVRVYRHEGERFSLPQDFSTENRHALTTPLFPGLELHLSDIFRS